MTLLQLARECPSELEADMQQEFGINLRSIEGVGVAHVAALAPSVPSEPRLLPRSWSTSATSRSSG